VTTVSIDDVREWMIGRVAFYLERPATEIDPDAELVELGLDSVYALTLSGDLEERFGLTVDSTLPWDYPTVNAMAGYVVSQLAAAGR
jgi:acyl carrier protein